MAERRRGRATTRGDGTFTREASEESGELEGVVGDDGEGSEGREGRGGTDDKGADGGCFWDLSTWCLSNVAKGSLKI